MRVVGFRALALVGLCLGWGVVGGAHARGEDGVSAAAWDAASLERHLAEAIDAVEAVSGVSFGQRPTARLSTEDDVRRLLAGTAEGDRGVLESAPDAQQRYLAYYDPIDLVVHVIAGQFGAAAAELTAPDLLTPDVLRIIVVHEVAHALDFQHYPVRWTLACCAAPDERLATEAILEGHAQLVAEEVARRWGIEPAFRRLTQLYTGAVDPVTPALVEGNVDQEAAFTYLQGHAFMRAILRARGRAGIDAVLRDPPFETRVIDRPELWLEPEQRGREHDLQAFLELFRPLVPPGEWDVGKWRILGPAGLTPNTAIAPGAESYLDNHGIYVGSHGGNRHLNVFVAHCRTARDADRFVQALRTVDESRDAAPAWASADRREGAGPEGKLPGFRSRRRAVGGDPASELTMHVLREGSYVLELSTYGLNAADAFAREQAVDLAARLLRAPPAGSAAVALRGHLLDFIGARAAGRTELARTLVRDLFPTRADLRRVIRPEHADAFAEAYIGPKVALRNTRVPDATVFSAFAEAAGGTTVEAYAATTEELAAGDGCTNLFPPEMVAFAREVAMPGTTWLVLSLEAPHGTQPVTYACFARFADRFLFVKNPWAVLE